MIIQTSIDKDIKCTRLEKLISENSIIKKSYKTKRAQLHSTASFITFNDSYPKFELYILPRI